MCWELIQKRSAEASRFQEWLEDAAIKHDSVVEDIEDVSAEKMIDFLTMNFISSFELNSYL